MVVQHNLQAMNANRMLNITSNTVASSTEKLSSGYRINRAADDAAGLAISEKMRKQIRGLDRASANAEDGISCVQTGEGALNEVQDMLQRLNELCVQAANGTNSVTDRRYIQDEVDQLVTEIDRVSETTKFNEIELLKGDAANGTKTTYITNYSVTYTANIAGMKSEFSLPNKVNYTGNNNIYIASNDVFGISSGSVISADKIQKGDDITKYMVQKGTDNKANASLDIENYAAFVKIELNSEVKEGKDGKVNSQLAGTSDADKRIYDLSYDGLDKTVRANREMYIYDTETSAISRITIGSEMTQYLNQDNTMKDRYRLLDILSASAQNVASVEKTTLNGTGISDVIRYTGETGNVFYVDENNPSNVSTIKLTKGQDITHLYYTSTNKSWAYKPRSQQESIDIIINRLADDPVYKAMSITWYEEYTGGKFIGTLLPNAPVKVTGIDGTELRFRSSTMNNAYKGKAFVIDAVTSISTTKYPDAGTSWRVMNSITGGVEFMWDDAQIEQDVSRQKLYDADGQEVSEMGLYKYFDKNGKYKGGLFTNSKATAVSEVFANDKSQEYQDIAASGLTPALIQDFIMQRTTEVNEDLELTLHVGADSDKENKIGVTIESMKSALLGVDKLHSNNIGIVDETGNNATDAIDVIADALQKVSTQRSALGAIQNRLEHTIKNLDNVVENTTSAESAIRDTDMADEMVKYSNNNVLQQAGQSMLAQANQANQGILSLLQ